MTALTQREHALSEEALLAEARRQMVDVPWVIERRKQPRISGCYPASVRWKEAGSRIRQEALLYNLSSIGLYMRVRQKMPVGQKAFVVFYMADAMRMPSIQMLSAMVNPIQAPRIAVCGSVLRVEPVQDGLWGVVLTFNQHRFL